MAAGTTRFQRPRVDPTADVREGAQVDPTAVIGPSAFVGSDAVIGSDAIISNGARVYGTVRDEAFVGEHAVVDFRAVVGATSRVGVRAHVGDGAHPVAVGDRSAVGDWASVESSIPVGFHVPPRLLVPPNARVELPGDVAQLGPVGSANRNVQVYRHAEGRTLIRAGCWNNHVGGTAAELRARVAGVPEDWEAFDARSRDRWRSEYLAVAAFADAWDKRWEGRP